MGSVNRESLWRLLYLREIPFALFDLLYELCSSMISPLPRPSPKLLVAAEKFDPNYQGGGMVLILLLLGGPGLMGGPPAMMGGALIFRL